MNTDASNVEDINIPDIKERMLLSCMSCIASEDWSNIFRTRSFTLCKTDRDFNERSDSMAASLSSSSVTNLSVWWVEWMNRLVVRSQVSPFSLPSLHQISTLEKTTSRQYSILRADERAPITSLPVLGCCSFHEQRGIWLSYMVSLFLSDAVEASKLGFLMLYRETKCIIGFDFAVTLSSLAPSCVLFDITSRQLVELKWTMLDRHQRWFHSSRVKFPLVSMSANCFLCHCIWFVWGPNWFCQPTNQEQLCRIWNHVSHCRASFFYDHLDHCVVVFKHIQQSFLTRRIDVWRNKINIVHIANHSMRFLSRWKFVRYSSN